MLKRLMMTALLVVGVSPWLSAGTLEGVWKHEKEPIWIAIDSSESSGRVLRNDNKPDAVGFEMLNEMTKVADQDDRWLGQVYAAQLGEFKKADIALIEPDKMRMTVSVGFFSRSVDWQRIPALPES